MTFAARHAFAVEILDQVSERCGEASSVAPLGWGADNDTAGLEVEGPGFDRVPSFFAVILQNRTDGNLFSA